MIFCFVRGVWLFFGVRLMGLGKYLLVIDIKLVMGDFRVMFFFNNVVEFFLGSVRLFKYVLSVFLVCIDDGRCVLDEGCSGSGISNFFCVFVDFLIYIEFCFFIIFFFFIEFSIFFNVFLEVLNDDIGIF